MNRTILGKTGFSIAPIVYGGIVSMNDGQKASDRYVSWAIDRGIDYFDVAPSYGDAQEKLGNSLIPFRCNIRLACKTTERLRVNAEKEFAQSMRLLHTDYFDVYQMHSLSSLEDVETAFGPGGVMEMMRDYREQGYILRLGITCHSEEAALRALSLYDFDTVMFPLNWMENMGQGFGSRIAKKAKEKNCGLLAIKGLVERAWVSKEEAKASRFPKSWCKPIDPENIALRTAAMKYTLSMGADALIPPGNFNDLSFMEEHINECLENPLSESDLAFLKAAFEGVREQPFFKAQ